MKYAIIIPAKNEEKNLIPLLNAISNQTLKPVVCLLLDDDSTDNTSIIIEDFKSQYQFFDYHKTEGSVNYQLGAHVANLFNKGVEILLNKKYEFDYVVKMDADLVFEPDIFESVSKKLDKEKYGIISPSYYFEINGIKKEFFSPLWHTNGQFKIYDIKCYKEINGLIPSFGWDCADNIVAIDKGWKTLAARDILFKMERPIGRYSLYEARRRQGVGAYLLGYNIFYLIIKGLYDFKTKPYIFGSFVYWFHFLKSAIDGKNRILNDTQIKLLRKLYWSSLKSRF